MRIYFIFVSILFSVIFSYGASTGNTAVNFLRIGTGAKASGMGEAQVAISDNVDSLYWNPAGLSYVKNTEISLMHLMYWQGISYEYAAIALPVKNFGTIGIGFDYLNSGNIDKTLENMTGSDYTPAGAFSYMAFAGIISYGNKFIIEKVPVSLGASIKLVGDRVENDMMLGAGLDFGLVYEFMKSGYLGIAINNIGITFSKNELLPLQLKVGGGYSADIISKDHLVIGALDIVMPIDASIKVNTGLEYNFKNIFFLRAGYKINYALENITVGAGLRFNIKTTQYELNYSYTPGLEDVGSSQRISLLMRFGLSLSGEISEKDRENYDNSKKEVLPAVPVKTNTSVYPAGSTPAMRRR
ncbi:MAG: PorV/PorQ family protein [Candidatus Firestonebacteria bacterium]|nr:PorV/PorQ family protein [Candidatus Firestonebacteria bacterium]